MGVAGLAPLHWCKVFNFTALNLACLWNFNKVMNWCFLWLQYLMPFWSVYLLAGAVYRYFQHIRIIDVCSLCKVRACWYACSCELVFIHTHIYIYVLCSWFSTQLFATECYKMGLYFLKLYVSGLRGSNVKISWMKWWRYLSSYMHFDVPLNHGIVREGTRERR